MSRYSSAFAAVLGRIHGSSEVTLPDLSSAFDTLVMELSERFGATKYDAAELEKSIPSDTAVSISGAKLAVNSVVPLTVGTCVQFISANNNIAAVPSGAIRPMGIVVASAATKVLCMLRASCADYTHSFVPGTVLYATASGLGTSAEVGYYQEPVALVISPTQLYALF